MDMNNLLNDNQLVQLLQDWSDATGLAAIALDSNDNPVTNRYSLRNICLLQLHVVYGGIIDLLWCLFNAIAFSLKKMYILAEDVYGR